MKSVNPENPVQDKGSMSEWKEYKLRDLTSKIGSEAIHPRWTMNEVRVAIASVFVNASEATQSNAYNSP